MMQLRKVVLRHAPAFIALALLAAACATRPAKAPPPSAAPAQGPAPGPIERPLLGRVICIDPGHGGPAQPGAVAPSNGLRESDVNLQVALALQQRLIKAGADVVLTRDGDYGLEPDDLSKDLAARAERANACGAELFVSVHHNADIVAGSDKNDLEVYYKLQDDGPSLDLAQCLMQALATGIRRDAGEKRLLPGNYKVLRLAQLPAILLESSYLTNTANAALLASPDTIEAEARSIQEGLENYFRMDPPRIAGVETKELNEGRTYEVLARFSRGAPIDGKSVRILVDGQPVDGICDFSEGALVWTFRDPLPNGNRHAELQARNYAGAAIRHAFELTIDRQVAHLEVTQRPETLTAGTPQEVLFEVAATDGLGMAVADGTEIALEKPSAGALTSKGIARFYIPFNRMNDNILRFASASAVAELAPRYGTPSFKTLRALDKQTRAPIPNVVVASSGETLATTTPEGWFALPTATSRANLSCPGYESCLARIGKQTSQVLIDSVDNGLLHDRIVAVDPAFGGRNPGAIGPKGTRASDVNLDIALRLAAQLHDAGAKVHLTRTGDSEPSDIQRLTMSDQAHPELFISISCGAPPNGSRILDETGHIPDRPPAAFVGYYPKSIPGARLARGLAQEQPGLVAVPCVAYLVQQMGCPAALVQPATVAAPEGETSLADAQLRQKTAENIYRAILRYFRT